MRNNLIFEPRRPGFIYVSYKLCLKLNGSFFNSSPLAFCTRHEKKLVGTSHRPDPELLQRLSLFHIITGGGAVKLPTDT